MHIGIEALGRVTADAGGRTYLTHFLPALARIASGDRITVYASSERQQVYGPLPSNVEVIRPFRGTESTLVRLAAMQMLPPRNRVPDVLFFPNNFVGIRTSCPIVVSIRSLVYFHRPFEVPAVRRYYRQTMLRWSLRTADHVITVSRQTADDLEKQFGVTPDRLSVVYHGVDHGLFRPLAPDERPALPPGVRTPFALFVSKLWPWKRPDLLIRAFAAVLGARSLPHDLVIAGDDPGGEIARLRMLAGELGIGERVKLLGRVDARALRELYGATDAFVFPSLIETFGNPIVEALACGAPSIVSNRYAVPEIAGPAALVVDPEAPGSLEAALARLLNDPALRARLRQASLARAAEFTWEKAARETRGAFERCVERQPRRDREALCVSL